MRVFVVITSWLALGTSICSAGDPLDAFPPPDKGMVRHVIRLPPAVNEDERRVELIIGKTVTTDATNQYFFAGVLATENIPGWGFDRYVLRELGPMGGTLMAVPADAPQVQRLVTLGGEPRLVRYNSRVPLVVDVPAGVEVRYRLWRAEPAGRAIQKVALPDGDTAVVAEGDLEARSIGSYSVRRYGRQNAQPGDDTTFFKYGLIRPRDGSVEKVLIADLGAAGERSLVVIIRSAGSGNYLAADAFRVEENAMVLIASVGGLPADADPVPALRASLTSAKRR